MSNSSTPNSSTEVKPIGEVGEYNVQIRESHLDMFGHVNNAVYLQIFEEARWELCTQRGFGLKEVIAAKQGPTILDVHLQFRREIRNREKILIRTFITAHSNKTSHLRQVMVNSKGEEACIADFVVGLFDMQARKLIEPTPQWEIVLGLKPVPKS